MRPESSALLPTQVIDFPAKKAKLQGTNRARMTAAASSIKPPPRAARRLGAQVDSSRLLGEVSRRAESAAGAHAVPPTRHMMCERIAEARLRR